MSVETKLPEYTVVRVDQLQESVRSGRGFKAFERSATILGFGALVWGGFFLYDLFSNTFRGMQEAFDEFTESPFQEVEAVVNPAALTEEGIQEALKNFRPGGGFRSRAGYEAALREAARKTNEQGVGTLTNAQVRLVKRAEKSLVQTGMIDRRDTVKIHPVDRVADFVLRDKNYFLGVLGLTVVPVLPVVGSMIREEMRRE